MAVLGSKRAIGAIAVAVLLCVATSQAASTSSSQTYQLTIGGGSVDSAAFRWSSALAETLSRPPGLPDCDPVAPCGVPGVVAGAQTYDDGKSLLAALADAKIATAVMPVLSLVRDRCDAAKGQKASQVSTLKILYRQPLYLVVHGGAAPNAHPAEWVGKTLATGLPGTDSETVTLGLLDAYRVPRSKVKLLRLPPAGIVTALRDGTAAVGFLLGHVFDAPVGTLVNHGFTLMSLPDSAERTHLLQAIPALEPSAIPPGTYPGIPATSIVAQPVAWVAGPGLDPDLAEKLVTAISEVHNQARIAEMVDSATPVPDGEAFQRLPVPLADGAKAVALSKHLPFGIIDCAVATKR